MIKTGKMRQEYKAYLQKNIGFKQASRRIKDLDERVFNNPINLYK